MSSEDSSSEEERIRSESFTTRFGRKSIPTFVQEARVEVSKNVTQVRTSTSKSSLPSVISKTVISAGKSKKVSVGGDGPNVSQVISPNVSEVVKTVVSKVDQKSELEVKNSESQNYEKVSSSSKQGNSNLEKMAERVEMSDQQLRDLITGIRENQQVLPAQNKLTTTLTDKSMPRFAGRRRPQDRPYISTQTFSQFLKDAESLMHSQDYQTDAEKINFLSVLADKTTGDFNQSITEIKNHSYFKDMSYDQVVVHLKSIYASVQEKTPVDATQLLLHDALIKVNDRALVAQSMYSYNSSLESVLDFFLESNPVEYIADQGQDETQQDYLNRRKEYVRNIIREFLLRTFWGNKLTSAVNKKAFQLNINETRTYQESLKKLHDAVSQTPLNEKCLVSENSKREVERNRDYGYDLEAYAMEVKEAQYSDYQPFEGNTEQEQHSTSLFTEVAPSGSRGQSRGNFNFQSRNPRSRGSRTPYRGVNNAGSYRGSNWANQYSTEKAHDSGYFPDRQLSNNKSSSNYQFRPYGKNGYSAYSSNRGYKQGSSNQQPRMQSRNCYNCGQYGHFIRDCRLPKNDRYNRMEQDGGKSNKSPSDEKMQ